MRLSYRLNTGRNQKISFDAAQNAVFLHLYNTGNIGSFVSKIFTMQWMRCDAALFLLYGLTFQLIPECQEYDIGTQGKEKSWSNRAKVGIFEEMLFEGTQVNGGDC